MAERSATIERTTKETSIKMTLKLDGTGTCYVESGIPFLDHLLEGFAKHGLFDLTASIHGDLEVDAHHTIEDTGIVLGQAIREAVGNKVGIKRYGSAILPMDEALILCAVDLSNRPYLSFDCEYTTFKIGDLETEMIHDFFYAISYSAAMNLHIKKISGFNNHHVAEATFKAFAKALDMATTVDERITGILSTKGKL